MRLSAQHQAVGLSVCLVLAIAAMFIPAHGQNTVLFDDFNGSQLSSQWTPYTFGGTSSSLSLSQGLLHLNSNGISTSGLNIGAPFVPSGDNLTMTARVRVNSFGRFHIAFVSQEPSTSYPTVVAAFELDLTGNLPTDCGDRGAAIHRIGPSDNYAVLSCSPNIGTWYQIQVVATNNPWLVTYNFMNDEGSLIATDSATDPNFSFSSIQYVDVAVWCGWDGCVSDYLVDWITANSPGKISNGQTTWDSMGLWTLSNVNPSTVTFPTASIARFTNFQFTWPPAVSLVSKASWTVDSRLVLLLRVRAWNFTDSNGGFAWQTALDWGSGSAVMGYGRDNAHSPNTGILVGGECVETTPGSVLTTGNFLGQWLTANLTLSSQTQTMYFSVVDPDGTLIGQTSSPGLCGTMFGTLPVHVLFFTANGQADVDWIQVTSPSQGVVLFDDFLGGQPTQLPIHTGSSGSTSLTVNPRTTSTTVSCDPATIVVGQPTSCTATVSDTSLGTGITPTGTVSWTGDGLGSFSTATCTLSGSGATATCSVTYSPKASGPQVVTATYGGEANQPPAANANPSTFVVNVSPPANSRLSLPFLAWIAGGAGIIGAAVAAVGVLARRRRKSHP